MLAKKQDKELDVAFEVEQGSYYVVNDLNIKSKVHELPDWYCDCTNDKNQDRLKKKKLVILN